MMITNVPPYLDYRTAAGKKIIRIYGSHNTSVGNRHNDITSSRPEHIYTRGYVVAEMDLLANGIQSTKRETERLGLLLNIRRCDISRASVTHNCSLAMVLRGTNVVEGTIMRVGTDVTAANTNSICGIHLETTYRLKVPADRRSGMFKPLGRSGISLNHLQSPLALSHS